MPRRRYISTEISIDAKLDHVSDFAALLYTWGIPHAKDDCRISPQNAEELLKRVVPGRHKTVLEVQMAVEELKLASLLGVDENGELYYPSKSFYKYQTYINAANRRETPENAASPSPSLSPSVSSYKNTQIPASPVLEVKKLRSEEKHMASMNLIPELKEQTDRLYYSDPVKFKKLAKWVAQSRKHKFLETDMAQALREAWDYRVIDDWYEYLDSILIRIDKDRNAAESFAEHERLKAEPIRGPVLELVGGGRGKA